VRLSGVHVDGGKQHFTWAQAVARSGVRCVCITSLDGTDSAWSALVKVRPHTRYRLSGWIKTEGVVPITGLGALLNVHGISASAGGTQALTGTRDWTRVHKEFMTSREEEIQINCLFGGRGTATGKAWFDDVGLTRSGVESANLLPNWSFEESAARPAGWTQHVWGGRPECTWAEGIAKSGIRSLCLASVAGRDRDATWGAFVRVRPSTRYKLSRWIKTEGVRAGSCFGAVLHIDEEPSVRGRACRGRLSAHTSGLASSWSTRRVATANFGSTASLAAGAALQAKPGSTTCSLERWNRT